MTNTKTSFFGDEPSSKTNILAPGTPTGPRPVSTVSINNIGHVTDTVTKQGGLNSKTKGKSNVDKHSKKPPRAHAFQNGVNAQSPIFFNESGHSMVESQSRSSAKGKSSAFNVMAEITHAEPYNKHLDAPQPPICHFGSGPTPDDILTYFRDLRRKTKKEQEIREMADGSTYKTKQRSSTVVLITALASYPGSPDQTDQRYLDWKELTISFAKIKYGDKLRGIYEHIDEPHGHLHIIIDNDGKPAKHLLTGEKAFNEAMAAGLSKKEAAEAKSAANVKLLDDYFEAVGKPLGMDRKSDNPKKSIPWIAAKSKQLKEVEVVQEKERVKIKAEKKVQHEKWEDIALRSVRLAEKNKVLEDKETALQREFDVKLAKEIRAQKESLEQAARSQMNAKMAEINKILYTVQPEHRAQLVNDLTKTGFIKPV